MSSSPRAIKSLLESHTGTTQATITGFMACCCASGAVACWSWSPKPTVPSISTSDSWPHDRYHDWPALVTRMPLGITYDSCLVDRMSLLLLLLDVDERPIGTACELATHHRPHYGSTLRGLMDVSPCDVSTPRAQSSVPIAGRRDQGLALSNSAVYPLLKFNISRHLVVDTVLDGRKGHPAQHRCRSLPRVQPYRHCHIMTSITVASGNFATWNQSRTNPADRWFSASGNHEFLRCRWFLLRLLRVSATSSNNQG